MTRFVRVPGPGEFRGEGTWQPFDGTDEEWNQLRSTGYLPVAWLQAPHNVRDGNGTLVTFHMDTDQTSMIMHHKAGVAVPLKSREQQYIAYAQKQLSDFVEQIQPSGAE